MESKKKDISSKWMEAVKYSDEATMSLRVHALFQQVNRCVWLTSNQSTCSFDERYKSEQTLRIDVATNEKPYDDTDTFSPDRLMWFDHQSSEEIKEIQDQMKKRPEEWQCPLILDSDFEVTENKELSFEAYGKYMFKLIMKEFPNKSYHIVWHITLQTHDCEEGILECEKTCKNEEIELLAPKDFTEGFSHAYWKNYWHLGPDKNKNWIIPTSMYKEPKQ